MSSISPSGTVSIIISAYNKARYISDTLDSVCSQVYNRIEAVVIDDHSTDGTTAILKSYDFGDVKSKVIVNDQNKGANFCRNLGLTVAEGEFVIFLDADDLLTPFCVQSRVSVMKEYLDCQFSVFPMAAFKNTIGDITGKWVPRSRRPLRDFLAHRLPWAICQPIWKKSFLIEIGGFDETFLRRQDVDLHTRALLIPDVKFKQCQGAVDCFYRADEDRINYNVNEFVERSVGSSLEYCRKFLSPAKDHGLEMFLVGTIYQTYLSILYYYKNGKLTKKEFRRGEISLLSELQRFRFSFFNSIVFRISRFFNLLPIRISGVNWVLYRLSVRSLL